MSRFLLRLDDACPTMRLSAWHAIEEAVDALGIRPLVGVIPDNRDTKLHIDVPDPGFWERVRGWQRKGWSIALHGLHHTYHPLPPGVRSLGGVSRKSEFAGLPLQVQEEKLAKGLAAMRAQGVEPTLFMAPSHTLDETTVAALLESTNIRTITDGLSVRAFEARGCTWIPQQLWRFRRFPVGLWTVCLHPNTVTTQELQTLLEQLRRFAARVTCVEEVLRSPAARRGIVDIAAERTFRWLLGLKARR